MSDEPDHAYNDPTLDSVGFMRAVMHDRGLPVPVRLEAAFKLAPYEAAPAGSRPVADVVVRIQSEDYQPTDVHVHPFRNLFEHRPNPLKVPSTQ
jgi:hypothetical protein